MCIVRLVSKMLLNFLSHVEPSSVGVCYKRKTLRDSPRYRTCHKPHLSVHTFSYPHCTRSSPVVRAGRLQGQMKTHNHLLPCLHQKIEYAFRRARFDAKTP